MSIVLVDVRVSKYSNPFILMDERIFYICITSKECSETILLLHANNIVSSSFYNSIASIHIQKRHIQNELSIFDTLHLR
jgi:hypothetical protein